MAKLLLATDRVDPDSKGSDGRTPLSYAAASGQEAVVKLLESYNDIIHISA
jgi:ankyrin repeat protein